MIWRIVACMFTIGLLVSFNSFATDDTVSANGRAGMPPLPAAVWGWGYGGGGLLGDGTTDGRHFRQLPYAIADDTDIIAVSVQVGHSLILKADGTVLAAGSDHGGNLGDGTVGNPEQVGAYQPVIGLTNVIAISAGAGHSLALRDDGTVWAWGDDYYGALGDGTFGQPNLVPVPQQVPGMRDIISIAAGDNHSLALTRQHTVLEWGGSFPEHCCIPGYDTTPRLVPELENVIAISTQVGHHLALLGDGTVRAWGSSWEGQLGNGVAECSINCTLTYTKPQVVLGPNGQGFLGNVVAIVAGEVHSLALNADGTVWAWGNDQFGQLGDGTIAEPQNRALPAKVNGLANVIAIAAGEGHSVALKADGSVWSWGEQGYGQLGNNTADDPEIGKPYPSQALGIAKVTSIAAGSDTTLALAPLPSPPLSPLPSALPLPSTPIFGDVPIDYWADAQIRAFVARGITTGCGNDNLGQRLYCPDRSVTRAEMAVFLTRALGRDEKTPPTTARFVDVPTTYWAYGQIEAFADLGITTGCDSNSQGRRLFCPDEPVTRAEMAAFLDRAKQQDEFKHTNPTFADVPTNYWAYGWIERFFTLNITTGCGANELDQRLFCPDRGVTRAEMAVFIIRAYP